MKLFRFFQNAVKINNKTLRQALIHSLNETTSSISTVDDRHLENTSIRVKATRQNKKLNNDPDYTEIESKCSTESTDSSGESEGMLIKIFFKIFLWKFNLNKFIAVTISLISSPEKTPTKSIIKPKAAPKTPTTATKKRQVIKLFQINH